MSQPTTKLRFKLLICRWMGHDYRPGHSIDRPVYCARCQTTNQPGDYRIHPESQP